MGNTTKPITSQCSVCNKMFANHKNMREHKMSHENSSTYTCDQCDKTYSSKKAMEEHKKNKHKGHTITATDGSFFRIEDNLYQPMKSENQCKICNKLFPRNI